MATSALHTNAADGAVKRFAGLGVPDFVVREGLRGVLAGGAGGMLVPGV